LALEDVAGVSRTISLDSRLPTTTQISAASPSLMASAIFGSDGVYRLLGVSYKHLTLPTKLEV
jgi:hypothetical protein